VAGHQYVPPSPIPLRRGGAGNNYMGGKLAFFTGKHPAFEGQDDVVPNTDRLSMAEQDNTQWAGAYRGYVNYPREIAVTNRDTSLGPAPNSNTRFTWGMTGNPQECVPASSRWPNANFFASDPMLFKSSGGGFVAGIGGGGISLNGMVPSGAWSFLTPGTPIVRPVYRQNYYGPVNPTMSTKDLQASSVYNPVPAWSTRTPTLP